VTRLAAAVQFVFDAKGRFPSLTVELCRPMDAGSSDGM
jgi:hypothetical protein